MKKLSDKTVRALSALLDVVGGHARGERDGINVWTEELSELVGGPAHVPFRDEAALCECAEWCGENGLPLLTMMLSADRDGKVIDQFACKVAFKHGVNPGALKMREAWSAERSEIAAMDEETVARARESLEEAVSALNASKEPKSRRALVNARNQEIEVKALEEWLDKYQRDVLDVMAPGQPLVHNEFMKSREGYKADAWKRWRDGLVFGEWDEGAVGDGTIARRLQETLRDDDANWITKRFGVFNLKAKLSDKPHGIEEFERAAYGFYIGDLGARGFFEKAVALVGRQYPVVSHLMFLKDKDAFVPVKPDAFEAGLRKLGVEFYLSGYCSWDNYTRFLGYLERIRQMLAERDPETETTLLDAHSVLWVIGSGYWFEGDGAKAVARVRAGELAPEQVV